MSYKLANQFMARVIALRPELLWHAAFLIGKRTDIGSPEDFVQDKLITAFQNADRFEEKSRSGWLIAILHNCIRELGYARTFSRLYRLGTPFVDPSLH